MKIEPRKDEKGRISIGPQGTSFGRSVVLVNPHDRDWTRHRYILGFGTHCPTYLMIWANDLDSALEESAEHILEHSPGYIIAHDSQELKDLVKEACDEQEISYPEGFDALPDEERYRIQDSAWANLTYTESGYLTSYEWTIALEDPSRTELDSFLYPAGIDWSKEMARTNSRERPHERQTKAVP